MMVSLDLRQCNPILLVSFPSMIICPDAASMIRNRDKATDDLPAPVLPTTPIWKNYSATNFLRNKFLIH